MSKWFSKNIDYNLEFWENEVFYEVIDRANLCGVEYRMALDDIRFSDRVMTEKQKRDIKLKAMPLYIKWVLAENDRILAKQAFLEGKRRFLEGFDDGK